MAVISLAEVITVSPVEEAAVVSPAEAAEAIIILIVTAVIKSFLLF